MSGEERAVPSVEKDARWREWLADIATDRSLSDLRVCDLVLAWAEDVLAAGRLGGDFNQTVHGGHVSVEIASHTRVTPPAEPITMSGYGSGEAAPPRPHEITREREPNVIRIACTCGHRGPWRRAALARNDLIRDEANHRADVRNQNRRP